MSGVSDLARLLALRSLREERAKAAASIAEARLQEASRTLSEAEAAIQAHDHEIDQQEQRFLVAMQMKPLPSGEYGRRRDLLGVSDQRREVLIGQRNEASAALGECERQLSTAQAEWRRRLFERDKLAEAERRLRHVDRARIDAIAEQDAEEMSADRARLTC
ncbi:hypothetical protein [Rhizobium sp. LCM 4573]|uniref:hypothetical protein n=1 Tax=Rhizobium sp. LCM 4573 TaxID=1848291 RepID=UPI0008DAB43B|nr:hypothetical protein [Rhizobium sp. LCM 4573]OHV79421.1 hypothetical protein LCM4573_25245 [Rhizobium sp. LCM 4573]